jgi:galactokinase
MLENREIVAEFRRVFGSEPKLYRAPGRVNVIGEHTDYNDGFVLPAALELATVAAVAPRSDRKLRVRTLLTNETLEFDLDDANPTPRKDWSDYVRGEALMLERAGHKLTGVDMLLDSNVPVGSGLSSSAALEVVVGYALLTTAGIAVDLKQLALTSQRAENDFVGMRCGIMDQFISCQGEKGKALLLDCRSLEYRLLPLPENVRLVICNTMVKHELAAGEYNKRRAECDEGVRQLAQRINGVSALRDVTMSQLESAGQDLPEVIYRRCRHVISENARVEQAAAALERGDLDEFGRLMGESHRSLRDDYEVSCHELDLMVSFANSLPGTFGARMTGGGFGGCTVNMVSEEIVE